MKDFFPIKLTALAYVSLGLWLFVAMVRLFANEAPVYVFVPYVILILLGLGILKKEKSVAIFSFLFLPLFLIWELMSIVALGFSGAGDPLTFLVSIITPPVLFVLTVWSLIAMRKDKKKKEV